MRPATTTHGRVRRATRLSLAAGLRERGVGRGRRRRLPTAELGRGRARLLRGRVPRRRRHADRALLRHEGSRLHPPAHAAEGVRHVRRVRTAERHGDAAVVRRADARARCRRRRRPVGLRADRRVVRRAARRPSSTPTPPVPALVAYTSGTTADPKGVIHTHRTIGFEVRQLGSMQPTQAPPTLTGAPVGHGIGMLGALADPRRAGQARSISSTCGTRARCLKHMADDGLMSGAGATFFLTSLLDHPDFDPDVHLPLMRHVGLGGATVPEAIADRTNALGISIVRMYGSTEHPSITGSTHDDPFDKRARTDGRPLLGCEMRLGRRRRDLQPWSRLLRGLHRPGADRRRRSTTTAGTAPRTSACSTTTATSRSPIARRT